VKVDGASVMPMEDAHTTTPLQLYFNPSLSDVDDEEVIAAGKFIHWTTNHLEARSLQVQHMVRTARNLITGADGKIGLDAVAADLCCIVMDIRHQGRGDPHTVWSDLKTALAAPDAFTALLQIGRASEPGRVENLTKALKTRRDHLATKKWSRKQNDFV
jgi:hypothetical protein